MSPLPTDQALPCRKGNNLEITVDYHPQLIRNSPRCFSFRKPWRTFSQPSTPIPTPPPSTPTSGFLLGKLLPDVLCRKLFIKNITQRPMLHNFFFCHLVPKMRHQTSDLGKQKAQSIVLRQWWPHLITGPALPVASCPCLFPMHCVTLCHLLIHQVHCLLPISLTVVQAPQKQGSLFCSLKHLRL